MMRSAMFAAGSILVMTTFMPSARAELRCEISEIRFGEIKSGAPLTQRYHIINRGPDSVEIKGMQTSCGCAVPHLEQRRLAVGEGADVELVVNTLAQGAGDRSWSVTIAYETEGKQMDLRMTLHGRVVSEIRVEPTSMHVIADKAITEIVQVSDLRPQPLHIKEVHGSAAWIRAQIGETTHEEDGTVYQVRVEIGEDCPEGQQNALLQMITDDPAYPELLVPVTVARRKRGGVHATPAQIDLRDAGTGVLPPRLVRLAGVDDQAVLVEKIEADHPALSCRWAAGPGTDATLRVAVDGTKVGADGLHTVVRVHLATGETLEIPVVCSPR